MLIDNKIEKTFSGTFIIMGITFLVIAAILILNQQWIFGVLSFILAGFILFTFSGIEIDTENRRIKPYYMVFGVLKRGKWESLENYRGLTLIPMKKIYTTFSRSNRKNTSIKSDFRVYLVNKTKKPAFPLKSCKSLEAAQDSMDEFSIWLKLPVYSIRR